MRTLKELKPIRDQFLKAEIIADADLEKLLEAYEAFMPFTDLLDERFQLFTSQLTEEYIRLRLFTDARRHCG